jgi:CRP-like cAMP-binding protein
MTPISSQITEPKIPADKSIPDHILDGSIVIDSVEAFKSILKQYPENASLLKAYSDFLTRCNLYDLAAKSYGQASDLFVKEGKILQAIVSKKLEWRIKPAEEKETQRFLTTLKNGKFRDIPLKDFFKRLNHEEMLAVISNFVRARLPAGTIIKKKGDAEDNLYFIVSGTLKDSLYPSIDEKVKVHRPPNIYLNENEFFGDVYPLNEDRKCKSDIETVTQVELVKLSKPKLIQLCKKFSNLELGILDLCKIRLQSDKPGYSKLLRKAHRYDMPVDMNLELYPRATSNTPVLVEGFSSDISVGGICAILDSKNADINDIVEAFENGANSEIIWVGFPAEKMHIRVLGRIAWSHAVILNGPKTLVIGIQFEEMSPRLRGMLFMFANSLQRPG